MAYDFLGLVNKVNAKVNEVQLTAANFSTAGGFYATAKDAVNYAIRQINQQEYEWPFNHVTKNETLIVGQNRYDPTATMKSIDYDSFRVQRNDTLGNETVKLKLIAYEEYLERFVDDEYTTENRAVPRYVFETQNRAYGIHPVPDQAYTLTYECYDLPVDLVDHDSVPSVPESFSYAIFLGAMVHIHEFRGDTEARDRTARQFEETLKNLRTIYINRYESIRDTRNTNSTNGNVS